MYCIITGIDNRFDINVNTDNGIDINVDIDNQLES